MPNSSTQASDFQSEIVECVTLDKPSSFLLYAGAGSGKTRSLVKTLKALRSRYGLLFQKSGQRVAVITYTNAACDEIKRRIEFDPIFEVSTIHSFAWGLIRTFQTDISNWVCQDLHAERKEIKEKQANERPNSKAASQRKVRLELIDRRLRNLPGISKFSYSPSGDSVDEGSVTHNQVIAITSAFLTNKPLMRWILVDKYPFLLIDESQDTHRDLIDAFFCAQEEFSDQFCLGLFGDTMQRIYTHGKVGLERAIPIDWVRPVIETNHRCPKRVVRLLNQIRSCVDDEKQNPGSNADEGCVRFFPVRDSADLDKKEIETGCTTILPEIYYT